MQTIKSVKLSVILSTLLFLPQGAFSLDWPTESGTISASFGWNDRGRPFLGTSFRSSDPVRAAGEGELLYSARAPGGASRLPGPLGAWIALDHGDGIISVYGRLDGDSFASPPEQVETGRVIAMPGESGWSGGEGFYFSLFDRKERRWINPSRIITPFADTLPPVILAVRLRAGNGRVIDLSAAGVAAVAQGRYTVAVETHDLRLPEGEKPLTPFRVICSVNGSEIGALGFETYSARDGLLMAYRNGLVPVREVYARPPAYEVGEVRLIRGQATLEIIAQDIAGNSRSAVFRLNVE